MKEEMNENTAGNAPQVMTDEEIAQGLNTDEARAGSEGLEEDLAESTEDTHGKELSEAKDKYLRLAAEFENYKRRTSRERMELIQTAGKDIVQSLLDVLDDSERAARSLETTDDVAQIKEGVLLVFSKLKSTMQARGLKQMEAQGADFDTELHEAVTEIPMAGNEGKVVDVIVPGYYLNDKLIRHAKVIVGKSGN